MIRKFVTVYPGHVDLPDMGQNATPANERRFTNDQLAGVFEKTEAVAKQMDKSRTGNPRDGAVLRGARRDVRPARLRAGHHPTAGRMQHINLSTSMGTPEAVMLEQLQWVAEAVMPEFGVQRAAAAA